MFPTDNAYYIGIDGGGTKTEFILFARDGSVLKKARRPGTNPNVCGSERSIAILKDGINELLSGNVTSAEKSESSSGSVTSAKTGESLSGNITVAGIYAGIAGLLAGKNKAAIQTALEREYPSAKIQCESDIFNVFASVPQETSSVSEEKDSPALRKTASVSEEENRIAAIAGTGSIVYVKSAGTLKRYGGWGYLLENKGSAFSIGRDALRAVLSADEGSGKQTKLTALVEEKLGGKVWDSIPDIYQNGNSFIASFAPLVSKAYRGGDSLAGEILDTNAAGLAELINHAAKETHTGIVILAGGMVTKDEFYAKMLMKHLLPEIKVRIPELPQVFGSCVLCCRLCGVPTENISEKFRETY